MKDNAPLPTILIFGGRAGEHDDMVGALCATYDCLTARTPQDVLALMRENYVQVVVSVGGSAGAEVRANLRHQWPETMIVVVDDPDDADDTVDHFVPRTWSPEQLKHAVGAAVKTFRLARENDRIRLEVRCLSTPRVQRTHTDDLGFETVLRAPGSAMAKIISTARQYASFDVPMLLLGEDGTGKATLARAIHNSSLRSDGAFHQIDLNGLSEDAASVAVFGRRNRAGAGLANKPGLVRKANHGTLYISGIETASPQMQARLLRLVRDRVFESDGDTETETSAARVIAATTQAPQQLDPALYYALSIAELTLPPLRMRKPDIALLVRAAVEDASRSCGKRVRAVSDDALAFLTSYDWPGNLRELENEAVRMVILSQDPVLGAEVVSRRILQATPAEDDATAPSDIMTADGTLKDRVAEIEARILRETLTRLSWNKSKSADELGLSRVGLRSKLDRYGIAPPQTQTEEA